MSQASSQASIFYLEVAKTRSVWTLKDDGGIPAPKNSSGQRVHPFWSTRSRVERIVSTVPAYAGFTPLEISWDKFCQAWVPGLEGDGMLAGVNWSGEHYTAKNPQSYYSNPAFPPGMMARVLIKEALTYFKEQGFDFSRLTSDNQNYVYAISAYYAGWCPNNWNFGLWPHQWYLFRPFELAPGKLAYDYQITDITNQLSLGTVCHENWHMICDFPDLYDYGQESAGIGNFCLMCSGNHANQKNPTHVNAYLKYKAGWAQVTGITAGMNATIQAGANQIYIHRNPSRPTEYFIIENREHAKRDL